MTPIQYKEALKKRLDVFDKDGATKVSEDFIRFLYLSEQTFEQKVGESILQLLRNQRMYDCMQKVADALIFTNRISFKVYRQNAQSLIDSGKYGAALFVLKELIAMLQNADSGKKDAKGELIEAKALLGRLYKQLYINVAKIDSYNSGFLKSGLNSYKEAYESDTEEQLFPGINIVALLWRAEKDSIPVSGFDHYSVMAKKILERVIEKKESNTVQPWDYASAAEACVAFNMPVEAEKWIAYYASNTTCDAFMIASTLRQFEEVWDLTIDSEVGKRVLPVLRNELLKRDGGNVVIDAVELRKMDLSHIPFEKNFGPNVFIDFTAYKQGYSCCESVARIGRSKESGDGTGFLLKGRELQESWGDEWVLLTNAHVISDDANIRAVLQALHPAEAKIIFEALDRNEIFRVGEILFYSPPLELDVTVVRFREDEKVRLSKLTQTVVPYSVSPVLPLISGDAQIDPRLYVIGHPDGGPLQFSMQDNLLLDTEAPRIHYRTPTEGGSSGSPVFNQQWELIGIHHAGKKDMKRLNGKDGTYEANEGIWIQAVKNEIMIKKN